MRHRKATIILDRRSGPRRQLLRTLAANIIRYERVRTTTARARAVRPLVERCITLGRAPSLLRRRQLLALLADPLLAEKVIAVLGPRFRDRRGGYTRAIPVGRRAGDAAAEVIVEFV